MLFDIAIFCKHLKDWWYFVAVLLNYCLNTVWKHSRYIFIETTTCDMAAALNLNACLLDFLHCLNIYLSWSK